VPDKFVDFESYWVYINKEEVSNMVRDAMNEN